MKIGIDAKWFFRGPPSGRRVVRNLSQSLAEVVGANELHFFLDDASRAESFPIDVPASRTHYVWAGNNQLSNVFVVPRLADRLGLDAVVYQNFVPPRQLARHARIAFIYDAIFETRPEFFTRRERLYFSPMRFLASSADRVCTGTLAERNRLAQHRYAQHSRIDIVTNGIDPVFQCRAAQGSHEIERTLRALKVVEPFILFVGRLNVRKNVVALVRAMAKVKTAGLTLVVAGAPDRTVRDLGATLSSEGVADRVRLLGAVDESQLRVLYASAAVFCFPSLDEGFGLCPLEAMASGTPVIVSNVGALVETCGDAAVYVDPTDPAGIAGAIDTLLADPPRLAALRLAGLRRAATFNWTTAAQQLLASVEASVAGTA